MDEVAAALNAPAGAVAMEQLLPWMMALDAPAGAVAILGQVVGAGI